MRRLRDLMQVQIADVDVRRFVVATLRAVLQAVVTQDLDLLLVLTFVAFLDALGRFDGQRRAV